MDRGFSNHRDERPGGAIAADRHTIGGLRNKLHRAFLPSDDRPHAGAAGASAPVASFRQVQVLADALAGVVGADAPAVALKLFERFGSLNQALSADIDALACALDHRETAVQLFVSARKLMELSLREEIASAKIDTSDPAFLRYLVQSIGRMREERLLAIYADAQGNYLRDEILCRGSSAQIEARVRVIVQRALDLGAAQIILAHNHPSGNPRPSESDCRATRRFRDVAAALDLSLEDHLIVTRTQAFSMRAGGLLT